MVTGEIIEAADRALVFECARLIVENRRLRERVERVETIAHNAVALLEEYIPDPARHDAHDEDRARVCAWKELL